MGKYEYQIFCSIGGCFGTGRMWCDNTPNPEMLQGANFVATGNGEAAVVEKRQPMQSQFRLPPNQKQKQQNNKNTVSR